MIPKLHLVGVDVHACAHCNGCYKLTSIPWPRCLGTWNSTRAAASVGVAGAGPPHTVLVRCTSALLQVITREIEVLAALLPFASWTRMGRRPEATLDSGAFYGINLTASNALSWVKPALRA
jgi:hypothetical protein